MWVILFLTTDLFDVIILAVDGDEDCRSALLAIVLRTEIIRPLVAHPYLHVEVVIPSEFFRDQDENNLTLNSKRGHST